MSSNDNDQPLVVSISFLVSQVKNLQIDLENIQEQLVKQSFNWSDIEILRKSSSVIRAKMKVLHDQLELIS